MISLCPGRRARVGHRHDRGALDRLGNGDAPVARQEDVDRGLELVTADRAERPGERIDHVGQAAGLGPRLALGRQERHPHRHGGHRTGRLSWCARDHAWPWRSPLPSGPLNRFTSSDATRYDARAWTPSTSPRSRPRASPCRHGWKGSADSPTTSIGRGIHRRRNLWSLIDRTAWTRYRNPIPVISGPTEWSRLLDDEKFLAEYQDVLASFDQYMANGSDHWFHRRYGEALSGPIAYFCAEYGFHESLGIYSGGLGVLAGDHMKSASDMALPAIGVGLLYRKGYFRQSIDADGHQEHDYPDYDLSRLPLSRVQDPSGVPLTVTVELPGRDLTVAVWLAQVGRVPVLLLDTDTPTNADYDRPITNILYVRGREMRLHQELVLGIGGVRALRALGLSPAAWHLNEGHSALLLAERAREFVADGDTLDEALAKVRSDSVFTIHTPVSAGNERFDVDLVRRVAGPLLDAGGVPVDRVLELGLGVDGDPSQFDMTAFSLRLTSGANAVSHLHGETANATWQGITQHPILGLTNGVHGPSWIGSPIVELLEDLGADLDDLDASHRGRPVLGTPRAHPGAGPVGRAPPPEARAGASSPGAGCAASSPGTARRPRCWPSSRPRSTRRS